MSLSTSLSRSKRKPIDKKIPPDICQAEFSFIHVRLSTPLAVGAPAKDIICKTTA